ncbi:uncharacterized protein TRUGW13939_05339 [Talaromyces rugulosus]|uniref:DUF2786 domain-containing protein n=1 Tax=Talaromyces rugulosus TaxID=121627 RepID=A0A7H8QX62_TALRU|nr:uncharacterized protein TRUGW13939_05339 [Talaromyces rugulosus]QKX58218.1 hypothetical protein TRUGW13939_05339 [Talaromyces rugulosus]
MPRSPGKPKLVPPPLQKATVKSLATDQPAPAAGNINVQDAVLSRLKKCLARGSHPNTSEKEARAALVIANRIMQQHNITQADMLAQEEKSTKAGSKHVVMEGFVTTAAHAIQKIPYNLIVKWARAHHGRSAAYCYCRGVADGLYKTAIEEKSLEELRARQAGVTMVKAESSDSSNADDTGSVWESEMQLVRFGESAEKIAQSYLEQNNIKVRSTKKRTASVKDSNSYTKGKNDSKKINVRQRVIEHS